MRMLVAGALWLVAAMAQAVPAPESVAVLFNSADPESEKLARLYSETRQIPAENLIGLAMPAKAEISRSEYESAIQNPLRAEFEKRSWWKRATDSNGIKLPVQNRIRVLVAMRGVPLKIAAAPAPAGSPPVDANDPIGGRNEASVDSELAMFGVEGVPIAGFMQNRFFKSEEGIARTNLPFLVLTARIDAASTATCERMIRDATAAGKTGLWGMAYVDIANKIPEGDTWLANVVKENSAAGIPTVVDRFNDTLPKNYPMTRAAMYFGWYDWHASGPLLNPRFRFKPGAVAVHIHSFSADQLANPTQNWSAALLEKGAAVTLGNVYEPYLQLTHQLDMLHQRLLEGHTWVEAAWMSIPVASWQGVVLGDPLYQPFAHMDGGGEQVREDLDFRALRAAAVEWDSRPSEKHTQLAKAAERTRSGVFLEALGLEVAGLGRTAEAAGHFQKARELYVPTEEKLRQDLHLAALDRAAGRIDVAVQGLREAQTRYGALPEAAAIAGWLDILDPPPPPPAIPALPAPAN